MIKTTAMLLEELDGYKSPKTKLCRMVKNGECIQVVKGIYETNPNVSGHLLAGSIYGPSYISFDYALGYYGMIPEMVPVVTCACFNKKKKKRYDTPLGVFTYRDVPEEAFPLGIRLMKDGEYWFRIASREKALCDKLYTLPPVKNVDEMRELLIDNLRIDEYELRNLDRGKIDEWSEAYRCTNVRKLGVFLRRL